MSEIHGIKSLRGINGLTQVELAEKVGIAKQTLENWEKGKCDKTIKKIYMLCQSLNCSLEELVKIIEGDRDLRIYSDRDETSLVEKEDVELLSRYLLIRSQSSSNKEKNLKSLIDEIRAEKRRDAFVKMLVTSELITNSLNRFYKHKDMEEYTKTAEYRETVITILSVQRMINSLRSQKNPLDIDTFRNIVQKAYISSKVLIEKSRYGDEEYARKKVFQTDALTGYIISWNPGQRSSKHHHGNSLDAIKVVSGQMTHGKFKPHTNRKNQIEFEGVDESKKASDKLSHNQLYQCFHQDAWVLIDRLYGHHILNESDKGLITFHLRLGTQPFDARWIGSGASDWSWRGIRFYLL
ncbi:helix-turn-helix domain-containing protein [Synechococcus sp. PCC 7336]|uniref:helix-turn-helix domain-containing protein n=1 Tax=Synechococcus sp. PCC 7336 TaxID=195250 RepID=UPI0003449991|nr:helix-turn-helix domain-containing protein [Synechococcus sp. PCC 7336]